jgi:hypothetical protein
MLCVIFIFLGFFAIYARITLRISRETALRNELNNIRLSIELYRIVKGRLPEDLITLVNQDFTFKNSYGIITTKKFLEPFRVDEEGYLVDPFLNRYYFDNASGIVRSTTKNYESW